MTRRPELKWAQDKLKKRRLTSCCSYRSATGERQNMHLVQQTCENSSLIEKIARIHQKQKSSVFRRWKGLRRKFLSSWRPQKTCMDVTPQGRRIHYYSNVVKHTHTLRKHTQISVYEDVSCSAKSRKLRPIPSYYPLLCAYGIACHEIISRVFFVPRYPVHCLS